MIVNAGFGGGAGQNWERANLHPVRSGACLEQHVRRRIASPRERFLAIL